VIAILFAAYGVVTYAFFFLVFLYAIAFTGNLPLVPKTIDTGEPGALVPSLIVNVALLGIFAVQHSVMARPAFKRLWTKIVAPPIERSTYVLLASLALAALCAFWRPLPQVIWQAPEGPATIALQGLFVIGFGIVLISTFLLGHFELFGLTQVLNRMLRRQAGEPEFRTPSLYKVVRHPLYAGFVLGFWATPLMSLGHLLLALGTTGYILIAIQLEEHDLIEVFGDRYRDYRRRVGMLLPKL
jgi:protein-S-isoprenylcysteine O-methyltransferase Ste14